MSSAPSRAGDPALSTSDLGDRMAAAKIGSENPLRAMIAYARKHHPASDLARLT